jgi:hypothetical protein
MPTARSRKLILLGPTFTLSAVFATDSLSTAQSPSQISRGVVNSAVQSAIQTTHDEIWRRQRNNRSASRLPARTDDRDHLFQRIATSIPIDRDQVARDMKAPSGSSADFSILVSRQVRNPVQRGHRFQRKADSIPVIADSR